MPLVQWNRLIREAIAAGVLTFHHIKGKANPADIMSKHYAHHDIWGMLEPIMFWKGTGPDYPKSPGENTTDQTVHLSQGECQESKDSRLSLNPTRVRKSMLTPQTI